MIVYDYQVGWKVLVWNNVILRKAESRYPKEPWTITSVHTNQTIRVQYRNKSERMNIRRVEPFEESWITVNIVNKYISYQSPTFLKDLCLVVSTQTNHTCHITCSQLRDFIFLLRFFPH
jgi:hypothetical protein